MSVEKRDVPSLTHLAMRIRQETRGAGPWDEPGTAKIIAELVGRNLHITTEHIIRNAADPKAKNPGVLRGGYTPPPPPGEKVRPLRREDQCARCGGPKANCHCTREHHAIDHRDDREPVAKLTGAEAVKRMRDAIGKNRGDA